MDVRELKGVVVNADGVTSLVESEPGVLTNTEEIVMRTGDFIEVTYTQILSAE
jgi:hypothetical protein